MSKTTNYNFDKQKWGHQIREDDLNRIAANLDLIDAAIKAREDAVTLGGSSPGIAATEIFKIPAGIAQGDIFYVDASGNIVRLAAGTNGYLLKTQGPGANPIWVPGSAAGNDVYGTDTFDGPGGVTITHNFGSVDYEFRIRPNEDTKGAIGEVWIDNLAANTIVVHNSGFGVTGFAWHLFAK